jgi:hypothetical protein
VLHQLNNVGTPKLRAASYEQFLKAPSSKLIY